MSIVDLFEEAASSALNDGRDLNICIATRHYPNIHFKHYYRVNMETTMHATSKSSSKDDFPQGPSCVVIRAREIS